MSPRKHQAPPRRINNPSQRPFARSSGVPALSVLSRLLARQQVKITLRGGLIVPAAIEGGEDE